MSNTDRERATTLESKRRQSASLERRKCQVQTAKPGRQAGERTATTLHMHGTIASTTGDMYVAGGRHFHPRTHRSPVDIGHRSWQESDHRPHQVLRKFDRRHSVEVVAEGEGEDGAQSKQEDDLEAFLRDRVVDRAELWILFQQPFHLLPAATVG